MKQFPDIKEAPDFSLAEKNYELTNHLGNVLAVVSAQKENNVDAKILSISDYYPFGMALIGRNFNGNEGYRYGFNGKENDDEVSGWQDYGARMYNRKLGRFPSPDPIAKAYPELTTYQFASNTPIAAIDLDGLEPFYTASRDFSIEWYNKNIIETTPNPNLATTKLDIVHCQRLKLFVQDNVAQYSLKDHNKVYYNSKTLGYYDCVTAVEASMQILKNDKTIKLPKGGNAESMGVEWEKSGLVGSSNVFKSANNGKIKKGDVVTRADFALPNVGQELVNLASAGDGTIFFTIAFGKDFHAGMVSVTTNTDPTTGVTTNQFNIYHQLGEQFDLTGTQFNSYLEQALFQFSTVKNDAGDRVYSPGGGNKISDGNQKVELRKIE